MPATGTLKFHGPAHIAAWNKEIDFNGDAIHLVLLNPSYTQDQDLHDYLDDIVANAVSGTNWSVNGVLLANCTLSYTAGTNTIKLDCDDVNVSNVTIAAPGASRVAIVDRTPATDATRPVIGSAVLDSALIPNGGPLTFTVDANGLFYITVA
jgi:hypothetical protein